MKANNRRMRTMLKTGFVGVAIILVISGLIGGFLWPYTINAWLVFFGKAPSVVFWHGVLIGFCPWLGQASIPAAVVTWILMLFLA